MAMFPEGQLRKNIPVPAAHEDLFHPMTDDERAQIAEQADHPVIKHAWCQLCGPAKTMCSTSCIVENGRWTHVEGNPLANNNATPGGRTLCGKGTVAMEAMYNPARLMYPLKRVGKKGEGRFVRCTWDEAMADIGAKLKETKEKYGAKSYAVLSPQAYRVLWTLGRRFLNVHGSPNYLHSGICALQRGASRKITIGKGSTEAMQLNKTKLLVNWGFNCENSRINQAKVKKFLDAKAQGMKVIDIRPMMDPLASKADIWVPVRPGTDTALALAILHVIIGEDLYDHEFVENWCSGFEELAEHVKQFPPAWAEPITGVPAAQIEEVARMMGTIGPMSIPFGNGVGDQQNDGNAIGCCISLISAITGNLDIPGGGGCPAPSAPPTVKLKPIDLLTSRLEETEEDRAHGYYAGMSDLVAPETPRWYQNPQTWESGPNSAYFKALMSVLTEEPYPIRFLLAQATNPLSATRQPKKVIKALEKLEFMVVADVTWNPSCMYADYVLPACTHYESSQQIAVKNSKKGTFVAINQKVDEPLAESVSDWDFYLKLGCAAGYGEDFWHGDMDACLREQLEGTGITLEQLREAPQGLVVEREADVPVPEQAGPNYEKLFSTLPDHKVQCYNRYIGGKPNADETGVLPALPTYVGPPESLTNTPELVEDYPLIFSDVHAYRLCTHGYFADAPSLRDKQPYPWVRMNPATARAYGIEDGDWIEVESVHGSVRLCAELFDGIAEDVLMARRGWWQSCEALELDGYGCLDGGAETSVLFDSEIPHFDPFHSAMAKQTLVRIKKIDAPESSFAGHVWPEMMELSVSQPLTSEHEPGRIVFDPERCIKCWACENACKQWNGLPLAMPSRRRVYEIADGSYTSTQRRFVTLACQQCADPACVEACAVGALVKGEDGVVMVDKTRCVRCGKCQDACPVGGALVTPWGMDKCDMCMNSRAYDGRGPHCVATCPTGALRIEQDRSEIEASDMRIEFARKELEERHIPLSKGGAHV